ELADGGLGFLRRCRPRLGGNDGRRRRIALLDELEELPHRDERVDEHALQDEFYEVVEKLSHLPPRSSGEPKGRSSGAARIAQERADAKRSTQWQQVQHYRVDG